MTPTPPKYVLLPIPVAQALMKYLEQRPYADVAQLIQALSKAPAAEIQPKPAEGEQPEK